ncbi:MAG: hypothetical protein J0L62_05575 [Bacteroidetes bacterium]|nr:hypothetical protein [Bacteroidota bacterium]
MKQLFFYLTLLFFSLPAVAQPDLSGNLQGMGTWIKPGKTIFNSKSDPVGLNQAMGYLNAGYYFTENFKIQSELRARFTHGNSNPLASQISDGSANSADQFRLDKTHRFNDQNSADFRVNRFYVDYSAGQVQLTAGRQRINWGMAMIWNPIDIFNTRNAVTFGEDLPSSDAARMQFYFSETGSAELVVKGSERRNQRAWAIRVKGNIRETDWQIFGGQRNDIPVAGFGWSGEFLKGGFRGEVLGQFKTYKNAIYIELAPPITSNLVKTKETEPNIQAVISYDYTFENSLYLLTECLWNPSGTEKDVLSGILNSTDNQWLSPGVLNLAHQVSFDLTPLVRIGGICLWNPDDQSWTAGPNVNWNLSDNIDLNGMFLFSDGNETSEYAGLGTVGFVRVKWSF